MKKLAMLLIGVGLSSCSVDEQTASITCSSTAQCEFGRLCKLPEQTCVTEMPDTFMGTFKCVVAEQKKGVLGTGDIIGNVGGTRVTVNGGTSCEVFQGDPDVLSIRSITSVTVGGVDYVTNVVLPWDGLKGGEHALAAPKISNGENAVTVMKYLDTGAKLDRVIAYSVDGKVVLDQDPVLGSELTGYVEYRVKATRNGTEVGIPCTGGIGECSDQPSAYTGVACVGPLPDDPIIPFCTKSCSKEEDCSVYGGSCVGATATSTGICLRKCQADGDCTPPHTCKPYKGEAFSVCFGRTE